MTKLQQQILDYVSQFPRIAKGYTLIGMMRHINTAEVDDVCVAIRELTEAGKLKVVGRENGFNRYALVD